MSYLVISFSHKNLDIKQREKLAFNFSFTRGFLRPYIYNSGELNYNEVFLVGLSYKIN